LSIAVGSVFFWMRSKEHDLDETFLRGFGVQELQKLREIIDSILEEKKSEF